MSFGQTTDEVAMLETREASPTHFLVKVESFSLLGKDGIHKFETGEFNAGGYKWRLIIYPNEDKTGIESHYFSVYLAISDTTSLPASWEVNAVVSFFLLNQISGNYLYSLAGKTRRFLAMKPEWGISKFISKKVVMHPSNGYLINDNCVFGAEVFIVENSAMSECLSLEKLPYKRDWKISSFSKLGDIWNSEQFVARGLTWKVVLHPKGNDSGTGRSLSAYLHLIESRGKSVKAEFSICIKNPMKEEHKKNTVFPSWFIPTFKDSWGWPEFMELATIEDPNSWFIVKDCWLLELELSVHAVV